MSDYERLIKDKEAHGGSPQERMGLLANLLKTKLSDSPSPTLKEIATQLNSNSAIQTNNGQPGSPGNTNPQILNAPPAAQTPLTANTPTTTTSQANGVNSTSSTSNINLFNKTAMATSSNLFKSLDSDPSTDAMDISFIQGTCFSINSDAIAPFNGQQIQPFQVGGNQISNNDGLKSMFGAMATSNSDCDRYAYLEFASKALSNSTACSGKPMCLDDCNKMNEDMKKCGFPQQSCVKIDQCVSLSASSTGVQGLTGVALAWWAILLIILVLLIPVCCVAFIVMRRRSKRDSLHSTTSSFNSATRDIAKVHYTEEVPVAPEYLHRTSSDLGKMI